MGCIIAVGYSEIGLKFSSREKKIIADTLLKYSQYYFITNHTYLLTMI